MSVLNVFLLLLAGGLVTSTVEFFLNYNLVDFLKDLVLRLFGKVSSFAQAKASRLQRQLDKVSKKL